jgi:hypothetical protein
MAKRRREMTLRGDLETVDLPDVLGMISDNKKTGIFCIRRGMEEKKLFFKKGLLVYASSTDEREKLGEILKSIGLVTHQQLLDMRKEQGIASSQRLGLMLVEKGMLTHDNLVAGLKAQASSIVLSLLGWWGGNFEFAEDEFPLPGGVSIGFDLKRIILQAVDSAGKWSKVKSSFPTMEAVLRLSAMLAEGRKSVTVRDEEWMVLSLLDGARTVKDICYQLPFSDLQTCQLLVALQEKGLVVQEISLKGRQSDEFYVERLQLTPLVSLFNELLRFIHRQVFAIDKHNARNILEFAYFQATSQEPLLFEGILLGMDGSVDGDIFISNALTVSPDFRLEKSVGALSLVVRKFLEAVDARFGKKERERITKEALVIVDFILHQNRNILQKLGIKEDIEVALGVT